MGDATGPAMPAPPDSGLSFGGLTSGGLTSGGLTVRGLTVRAVRVPLTFALGTSAATLRSVPMLLAEVTTDEGVRGRAYAFCYTDAGARAVGALIAEAAAAVAGEPCAPAALHDRLVRHHALLGVTGAVRIALSTLDVALWDALAVAAGLPLCRLLGGACRAIPAYDSRGLGLVAPERLADEAAALVAGGAAALKLRLGHPDLAGDLRALSALRGRVGEGVPVMVDYNQALAPAEALRRGRALDREGIVWLEEPLRHDDYRAAAALARSLDVPVQIGENFNGPEAMAEALAAGACDLAMPDVCRIGGVTGWMRAAGLAAAGAVPLSSHLMPEISVHLLAASPTAHWLEWVDWAGAFLVDPPRPVAGMMAPPGRPGLGLEWDEARIARLDTI
jgi:mandelate racemase